MLEFTFSFTESEIIELPNVEQMIVPVQNGRATVSEERKEDIDELDRIEKFYLSGCSCQLAQGAPCCKSIQKSIMKSTETIVLK